MKWRRRSGGAPGGEASRAGALYVHLQSETGTDHRTIVLSPGQAHALRTLWSRWGFALLIALVGSWVYFGVQATRVPFLTRRVAELETEALRLDTLRNRLMELQQRYDQVHRMLGVPFDSTGAARKPLDRGSKGQ